MTARFTSGGGGGGGGTDEDEGEDPTPENPFDQHLYEAAQDQKQVKDRVRRLEENRAMRSDVGGSFSDPDAVLSPISRIVDRGTCGDTVTVTTNDDPQATVIDSFEDGGMTEYSGDTTEASTVSYPTVSGDLALKMDTLSDGSASAVVSTSGLPYYPNDGDTFRYHMQTGDGSADGRFFFGAADTENAYRVEISPGSDEVRLGRVEAGVVTDLGSIPATITTFEWYEVEVRWADGGGLEVETFDESGSSLGTITSGDSTYLSGGVGWGAISFDPLSNEQENVFFDYARTTSGGTSNVIDSFEDTNITEYSGDTGSASVRSSVHIPVYHGTYALELVGSSTTIHAPQGNLNDDAVAGDTFASRHYLAAGSQARFLFGVQDGSNFYYVEADDGAGTWTLGKVEGGAGTTLGQATSVGVLTGEWLRFEVEWGGGGTMTATLYAEDDSQVAQVSGSSTTWTAGGHGWAEIANVTSYADYALVVPEGAQSTPGTSSEIDTFEDGDLDEYSPDPASLNTVQSATVYEGTYALQTEKQDGNREKVVSTNGLPNYPEAGDTWEYWFYMEPNPDNIRHNAYFGHQDSDNSYWIRADSNADHLRLFRYENASATTVMDVSVALSNYVNEWLRVVVEWGSSGGFTITLYDRNGTSLASGTATDTTFTAGGVGWQAAGNTGFEGYAYTDSARVTSEASGRTTGLIDSFEDNDISEYSGDSVFETTTAKVYAGTYALRAYAPDTTNWDLQSYSGLERYPQAGDTFQMRSHHNDVQDGITGIKFGLDGSGGGYMAIHEGNNNTLQLRKLDDGTTLGSQSVNYDTYENEWLRIKVEWGSSGTITVTAFDGNGNQIGQVSGSDSTHTSGGVGYKANTGASTDVYLYYDLVEITNIA